MARARVPNGYATGVGSRHIGPPGAVIGQRRQRKSAIAGCSEFLRRQKSQVRILSGPPIFSIA